MIQVQRPEFFRFFYIKIITDKCTDNEWCFYNVIIIVVGYFHVIKKK